MRILGFTLIELLLALGIVGIIAYMAVPSYSHYTVAAKRTLALVHLMRGINQLDDFYTKNHSYAGATLQDLGLPNAAIANSYVFRLSATTNNNFCLAAIPQGHQAAADLACGTLMIDAQGQRHITGNANVAQCWQF
jgi:type IV pilus assembly protein PilE